MPSNDSWQTSRAKPPHLRPYRIVRALGVLAPEDLRALKARAELAEERRLAARSELAVRHSKPKYTDEAE